MPVCTIQGRIARVILVYFQSPDTDAQDSNKYNLVFVRRRGLANFNDNVITNKKGEPPAKVARFLLNPGVGWIATLSLERVMITSRTGKKGAGGSPLPFDR